MALWRPPEHRRRREADRGVFGGKENEVKSAGAAAETRNRQGWV